PDAAWGARWAAGTAVLREAMRAQPTVVVHRDFMVRNLLVATPNPGVIDFQDALVGPVTYDLASLLRDAFFSLTPDAEQALVGYYRDRAAAAGIRLPADLSRALDRTAAQRHLKVLGIFARLYHRDHKPGYLADAPRFLDYLSRELGDDPAGHDLAALIAELPRPERADSP
ncbi:phosphotransferase, partial [Spiribacter roseus]|uniref:phosphotransferase n=1 Tax=Spiribacter roseus TaxID=1855875 RepID=UPI001330499D